MINPQTPLRHRQWCPASLSAHVRISKRSNRYEWQLYVIMNQAVPKNTSFVISGHFYALGAPVW